MTTINLLPWRAELRQKRKKEFRSKKNKTKPPNQKYNTQFIQTKKKRNNTKYSNSIKKWMSKQKLL